MASIAELSAEANSYNFSPQVSFASWLHVCQTLQRESRIYDAEDQDLERAYILYLRFADLVLNKLRTHPQFLQYKKQYFKVYSQLPAAIESSENLKQRILKRRAETPTFSQPKLSVPPQNRPMTLEEELDRMICKPNDHLDDREAVVHTSFIPQTPPVVMPPLPAARLPAARVNIPQYPSLYPSYRPPASKPSFVPVSPTALAVPTSCNEQGQSLRQLIVPQTMRSEFLNRAQANTDANLETCGMLCGKLQQNAFFVTDLVIPHQTSTADTCLTTSEEELFEYVDQRDLFIVGWIHTHPSQTCFMSSVDLHTHASYQLMLPEAVAVVCSPHHEPFWAAFRLTDPPGIPTIRQCKQTGFHPHPNANSLYTTASQASGHYHEVPAGLVTADLRTA